MGRLFTTFDLPLEAYSTPDDFVEGPIDYGYAEDGTPDPGPCPIDGVPHHACTSPEYTGNVQPYVVAQGEGV